MNLRHLTPSLAVAPQIAPGDLPAIAAAGFTTLICNRFDGEQPGQPDHDAMAAAAQAAGLRFAYLPVVSGQVTPAQGQAFGELLAQAPGPVLAYCRSGMRCATLWVYAQAGQQPWPDLLRAAAAAGYDLRHLPPPAAHG